MTWAGQVAHIIVKDLRQARWFLLAYLAVVALATARAVSWIESSSSVFMIMMPLVVAVGMFFIAFLVQADSPVESDAFWASRPFYPTAMLAAKLVFAATVIVGIALGGQIAALLDHGVESAEMSVLAGRSAQVFGYWLLLAIVAAALTTDLRGFTTVLAGVLVTFAVVSALGSLDPDGRERTSRIGRALMGDTAAVLGVAGAVAVLVALYHKRGPRRLLWGISIVTVFALLISIFSGPRVRPTMGPVGAASADPLPVEVEVSAGSQGRPTLIVRFDLSQPRNQLAVLDGGEVVLELPNDSVVRVSLIHRVVTLARAALPIGRDVRVIDAGNLAASSQHSVPLVGPAAQAMRTGVARAYVRGEVSFVEPRVVASMPFRIGATHRSGSRRVEILASNPTFEDSLARISLASVSGASGFFGPGDLKPWWDTPRYILVNDARGEAIVANQGSGGLSSEALVLPGAWQATETAMIRRASTNGSTAGEAWLRDSRLVLIDWTLRRRARVNIEARVR